MAMVLGLWFTSTVYWQNPRKGWRRNLDYLMVASSIILGTIVACQLPTVPWTTGWLCVLAVIGAIFVANETRFWLNPNKTERDYKLAVRVHAFGVHILGNVAIMFLIFGEHSQDDR